MLTVGMPPKRLPDGPGNGGHLPAPSRGSPEPDARHICLLGYTNTPCCLRTIAAFPGRLPPRSPAGHRPPEPRCRAGGGGEGGGHTAMTVFHTCTPRKRLPVPRATHKEQKVRARPGNPPTGAPAWVGGETGSPGRSWGVKADPPPRHVYSGRASSTEEMGRGHQGNSLPPIRLQTLCRSTNTPSSPPPPHPAPHLIEAEASQQAHPSSQRLLRSLP